MEICLDAEELRDILLGKMVYKKCPCCDKEGLEYWNEDGEDVSPAPKAEWGEDYCSGTCENCNGLAFVPGVHLGE